MLLYSLTSSVRGLCPGTVLRFEIGYREGVSPASVALYFLGRSHRVGTLPLWNQGSVCNGS
jgi:hypothetical protein